MDYRAVIFLKLWAVFKFSLSYESYGQTKQYHLLSLVRYLVLSYLFSFLTLFPTLKAGIILPILQMTTRDITDLLSIIQLESSGVIGNQLCPISKPRSFPYALLPLSFLICEMGKIITITQAYHNTWH